MFTPSPRGYRQFLLLLHSPQLNSVSFPFTLHTFIYSLVQKTFHHLHQEYFLPESHSTQFHSARPHSVKSRLVEPGVFSLFYCMCKCLNDVSLSPEDNAHLQGLATVHYPLGEYVCCSYKCSCVFLWYTGILNEYILLLLGYEPSVARTQSVLHTF